MDKLNVKTLLSRLEEHLEKQNALWQKEKIDDESIALKFKNAGKNVIIKIAKNCDTEVIVSDPKNGELLNKLFLAGDQTERLCTLAKETYNKIEKEEEEQHKMEVIDEVLDILAFPVTRVKPKTTKKASERTTKSCLDIESPLH